MNFKEIIAKLIAKAIKKNDLKNELNIDEKFVNDIESFIEIPETDRGYMLKYLSYMVKRNIMEELIINSDTVTNEQTLYQLFAQKEEEFYSKTETELKFKGLNLGISKYARRIKSEFKLYNI